jgi:hypothetical protein
MVFLDLAKGLSEQIPNKKPLPYCYANFFFFLILGQVESMRLCIYPVRRLDYAGGNCSRAINRRYITDQRAWFGR